jgi:organic radical activating enzyme
MNDDYLLFAGLNNEPEVFFTLEGEGEHIGKPSVFMRFFGCNLTCKAWTSPDSPNGCDSFISWSKKNKLSFEDTFNLLEKEGFIDRLKNGAILKYTGGEPLLRQDTLYQFTTQLFDRYGWRPGDIHIDFETNATIMPNNNWLNVATFTTSPKLSTNGDPEEKTYKPDVLKFHKQIGSGFKFVVTCDADIDEIWKKYIIPFKIPTHRIWFMPCCGSKREHDLNATIAAEYAKQMGVNFSPRLQLVLWDKAIRA